MLEFESRSTLRVTPPKSFKGRWAGIVVALVFLLVAGLLFGQFPIPGLAASKPFATTAVAPCRCDQGHVDAAVPAEDLHHSGEPAGREEDAASLLPGAGCACIVERKRSGGTSRVHARKKKTKP